MLKLPLALIYSFFMILFATLTSYCTTLFANILTIALTNGIVLIDALLTYYLVLLLHVSLAYQTTKMIFKKGRMFVNLPKSALRKAEMETVYSPKLPKSSDDRKTA